MRKTPEQALVALMPGLRKMTGDFAVRGDVKIRPADLYVTKGHRQPGIVLVVTLSPHPSGGGHRHQQSVQ